VSAAQTSPGARLREQLAADEPVVCPGAMNALNARLIEQAGFTSVYMTGAGVANGLLGQPDVGLTTLTEMAQMAANISAAVDVPVFADADTGFGGSVNVERTVQLYERAGVAALQIEDQVVPKRCGHFEGKEVVSTDEMRARLRAARAARRDESLMIVARTDARSVSDLDDAIARGHAYAEEGADALFIEAPTDDEELARVGEELASTGLPLVANMVEGGKTPLHSASELAALGFKLVIFPGLLSRITVRAVTEALAVLAKGGDSRPLLDRVTQFSDMQRMLELDELNARVAAYELGDTDVAPS
jgi:2-methylisocitrate lyase-like PEP mutase family enzyme